jgi:hypothetical protein
MLYLSLKHFWVFFTLLVFLWPQIAKAAEPPNLNSPTDNSVTSDKSPKLFWEYSGECAASGSCFRVEVDNSADFSDPEKSTYTDSLSYSPQGLTEGIWNWRVKAKDKNNKWSDWSKVFKFVIGTQPSSIPSPTSQATLSPQTTQSSPKPQSNFEIKDAPSEINSNQEFELSASLVMPKDPNQSFYLKAAFKKSGSSNYFGETFSNGEWVKNGTSYSKQFKIQTDSSGKWAGKIKIRVDADDSGFEESGDYLLKVGRYSDSGSGPTWSNELTLKINKIDKPSPSPSENSAITEAEEEEDTTEVLSATFPSPSRDYEIKIASVAGEATMSNNIIPEEEQIRVLEEKKVNWLLIFLGIGIATGGSVFAYLKVKKDRLPVG